MLMAKTIFSNLLKKYSTRLYPGEQRILPDGFRGRFKFVIDKCILCRQCVVKCPTKVIRIDPEIGLWEREVMGCLYCGVCADVCPTGCIAMTNTYRPPITEQSYLRFNVKPRPSKKKAAPMDETEIQEAIQQKISENNMENGSNAGKNGTVEEDAVTAAAAAPKEKSPTLKPPVVKATRKKR